MAKVVEWEKTSVAAANTVSTGQLDPVCGKRVAQNQPLSAEYKQRRYYFCSSGCKDKFHERTERFRLNELARAGALLTPGKVRWGLS